MLYSLTFISSVSYYFSISYYTFVIQSWQINTPLHMYHDNCPLMYHTYIKTFKNAGEYWYYRNHEATL